MKSRKTECAVKRFLACREERAALFALLNTVSLTLAALLPQLRLHSF
jgi:hypothetical protein